MTLISWKEDSSSSTRPEPQLRCNTVEGQTPTLVGMDELLCILGQITYQLVWDFVHPEYDVRRFVHFVVGCFAAWHPLSALAACSLGCL